MRFSMLCLFFVGINGRLKAGPLIKYFKENGCVVIHKCTTIRHAKVCVFAASTSQNMLISLGGSLQLSMV